MSFPLLTTYLADNAGQGSASEVSGLFLHVDNSHHTGVLLPDLDYLVYKFIKARTASLALTTASL